MMANMASRDTPFYETVEKLSSGILYLLESTNRLLLLKADDQALQEASNRLELISKSIQEVAKPLASPSLRCR